MPSTQTTAPVASSQHASRTIAKRHPKRRGPRALLRMLYFGLHVLWVAVNNYVALWIHMTLWDSTPTGAASSTSTSSGTSAASSTSSTSASVGGSAAAKAGKKAGDKMTQGKQKTKKKSGASSVSFEETIGEEASEATAPSAQRVSSRANAVAAARAARASAESVRRRRIDSGDRLIVVIGDDYARGVGDWVTAGTQAGLPNHFSFKDQGKKRVFRPAFAPGKKTSGAPKSKGGRFFAAAREGTEAELPPLDTAPAATEAEAMAKVAAHIEKKNNNSSATAHTDKSASHDEEVSDVSSSGGSGGVAGPTPTGVTTTTAAAITAKLRWHWRGRGIRHATSADWVPSALPETDPSFFDDAFDASFGKDTEADVVVVCVGLLDRCPPLETARNVVAICERLADVEGRMVLVALPPVPHALRQEASDEAAQASSEESRAITDASTSTSSPSTADAGAETGEETSAETADGEVEDPRSTTEQHRRALQRLVDRATAVQRAIEKHWDPATGERCDGGSGLFGDSDDDTSELHARDGAKRSASSNSASSGSGSGGRVRVGPSLANITNPDCYCFDGRYFNGAGYEEWARHWQEFLLCAATFIEAPVLRRRVEALRKGRK